MKINKTIYIACICLICSTFFNNTYAQGNNPSEEEIAEYENKVKDIVTFFEYVLNTLGKKTTSARDKDVIVSESYTKIFRDDQVQIQDDLDESRDVITYKNVQAYLKDVDFFFRGVSFDFNMEDVSHYVTEKGELFFKVSLTRNLRGIGIEGDSINNTQKRFIEINLNEESQDLKIVSIYTDEFSQKEALARWWNDLSYEWKAIFKRKIGLADSATASDIKNIAQISELDISDNKYLTNIEPLAQLTNLMRLDLAGTYIEDLKPIRNLTRLEELNLSSTQISSLDALKYATSLKALDLNSTTIDDISVIKRMGKLQKLDISQTNVLDLSPATAANSLTIINASNTGLSDLDVLAGMKNLQELNISSTNISSFTPISHLTTLKTLIADSTNISDLSPLRSSTSLETLSVNNTPVSDLDPLDGLEKLKRIYCDATYITHDAANTFMKNNPGVLVIFESEDLKNWWAGLPVSWKTIFEKNVSISSQEPNKEELAKIAGIDSLNLAENIYIESLVPLIKLTKLDRLDLRGTPVFDLTPLESLKTLRYLDISNTEVTNYSPLAKLTQLKTLKASKTEMASLDDIRNLTALRELDVDQTLVHEVHVKEYLRTNPKCLVIFKSEYLSAWWQDLDQSWKDIFSVQTTLNNTPTARQLHRLIGLNVIQFSDANISDLTPLKNFLNVKELRISGTAITDLSPITEFVAMEIFQISKSPVTDLSPLKSLSALVKLDISNTPVSDLGAISNLGNLEEINCSGTQIKSLKALDNLAALRTLDCSNTNVKRLDEVSHLAIKVLKCYNTRVSSKRVEEFKQSNPDCNVIYY